MTTLSWILLALLIMVSLVAGWFIWALSQVVGLGAEFLDGLMKGFGGPGLGLPERKQKKK
jgi:hypothetical protein